MSDEIKLSVLHHGAHTVVNFWVESGNCDFHFMLPIDQADGFADNIKAAIAHARAKPRVEVETEEAEKC